MPGNDKPIDTIRLSDTEKQQLVEEMNQTARPAPAGQERRRLRVAYNPGQIRVSLTNPGGNTSGFSVVPRNISTQGLAFLHGGFVHPGSLCIVELRQRDGTLSRVFGRAVHCRHVGRLIHEVALHFEQAIDLESYVDLDPRQRARVRHESRGIPGVQALVTFQPDDPRPGASCLVRPARLSEEQLTFVHGLKLPAQTPVRTVLFGADDVALQVGGRVEACQAISSVAQELTLRFDRPVGLHRLRQSQPAAQGAPAAAPAPGPLRHVLVVQMDADAPPATDLLQSYGWAVTLASQHEQMVEALRQNNGGVLLLDTGDHLDEFPVLLDVARRGGFDGWIIVAGNAMEDDDDTQACALAVGGNAFLPTPFDPVLLRLTISRLLSRKRTERAAA